MMPFSGGSNSFGRVKGLVRRSPQQEAALRVRILDGLHTGDIIAELEAELGTRSREIGKIDMSRNTLAAYVERRGRAYRIPPAVTGLGEDLARAIGDASAASTVTRYAKIEARPMPTVLQDAAADALRYRLGANWCGVAVGWSERSKRPFVEVIAPDDLEVTYASDDPLTPTVIKWRRTVTATGGTIVDVSDLTDLDNPSYRIEQDGVDVTEREAGESLSGEGYWWRYEDGRPFHRIVISGDPRKPYLGLHLVDGTLRLCTGYTSWWAGMRDAGFPSRHAIQLELLGSDAIDGAEGQTSGPEVVHRWAHMNPDRPGQLIQLGPGFDPEAVGRGLRTYELGMLAASGLPVSFEETGGEPTESEARELEEAIQATYSACRGQDTLLLRRIAAVTNRSGDAMVAASEKRPYPPIPEGGYGVLYRDEIHETEEQLGLIAEEDGADGGQGKDGEADGGGSAGAVGRAGGKRPARPAAA